MFDTVGQIVEARAGRDKGKLFCVVGVDKETGRLLLADGKGRRMARPKAKAPSHVNYLAGPEQKPVTQKLQRGETVSNRELRRALGAFKEEIRLGKR